MEEIESLAKTVERLRGPGGCPWDMEQTFQSLTPHILEESYEWIDAIKKGNISGIKEEAGDVLLQVLMISQIANETNLFSFSDVARKVNEKMIERHPHVFGDVKVEGVQGVWENWEKIKQKNTSKNDLFDSIPKILPSLLKAEKVQKKVSRQGFDWSEMSDVVAKVEEEMAEFKKELDVQDKERMKEEFGDLLFSMVNLGRKCGFCSEEVMSEAVEKFKGRYLKAMKVAEEEGRTFSELPLDEKEK